MSHRACCVISALLSDNANLNTHAHVNLYIHQHVFMYKSIYRGGHAVVSTRRKQICDVKNNINI